ncbi:proline dehydrogenase family protein [Sulfobacillus acidophilus]|uniref:L-glutamate gamma-semialdehyde dehydrogenase n=1 Tax=Sulfobacillus acidophilus TaxID=53633 RepID=A0ABS3AVK4_9FIRM|nr:proline dehydrogenase family protein [Sulfobacillus acidophilus]
MVNQSAVLDLGREIFAKIENEKPGIFDANYWQGALIDWVLKDPGFKIDMFRFVDVLPVLKDSKQIQEHVKEYLLKKNREIPLFMGAALKIAARGSFSRKIAAHVIKRKIEQMAHRFIVGQNAAESIAPLLKLHKSGVAFSVDLLGEATLSEQEAHIYQQSYLEIIKTLAKETKKWPSKPIIDADKKGPIPRANVSIKLTAMGSQLLAVAPKRAVQKLKTRVLPLFLQAAKNGVFLNVDLESWETHEITHNLFEELLLHPELKNYPHFGIVNQCYLKSAAGDLNKIIDLAKKRQTPITIRLVKGAYWDYEVVHSKQNGLPYPVFLQKELTDKNYESLSIKMLENIEHLTPAFGSHNLRSLVHAMTVAKDMKIAKNAYEIQMLYGMAEPERYAMRDMDQRIRVYAPIGQMLPGIAYLVRRLLENTANTGFLKLKHHSNLNIEELLAPLKEENMTVNSNNNAKENEFINCSYLDFTNEKVRRSFKDAVESIKTTFPQKVPVFIGANKRDNGASLKRICPSNNSIEVAKVVLATTNECEDAVKISYSAFLKWQKVPLERRCLMLENLAQKLQDDRLYLAALQTYEVAKPWADADADVAEAIDFCRYYAKQARIELSPKKQGNMFGEENWLKFNGRGPTVVIAPWNFPLAILCGMSVAALVSGNSIIMKPAEQSSLTAYALYERMVEVGFEQDVVQFLPGIGEDIGPCLVNHPLTSQIAFTGSKDVGHQIVKQAAIVQKNQVQMKRVVCEMGGKNATIIDDDADLDEAVLAIIKSAFGYAGQKCSACSLVFVAQKIYETFALRLVEACKSLDMGPAHHPQYTLGPVVDIDAQKRLLKEIENVKSYAQTLYIGSAKEGGCYVPPAIFTVDNTKNNLMKKEFFGPILAIMKVRDFKEGLQMVNESEFALTGAVFSRSPSNIELAKNNFSVGNLYINQKSTGALVARQPFGGFKMSGMGIKAGGPGYLLQFVDLKCITENTTRRGFTPELDNV